MGTHSAGIFQYLQHCLIFWETCQECCRGDWPWMLSLIWKRHRAYVATIQHIPDSFPLPAAKLRSSKGLFLNCSLLVVAQLYPTLCKPLDCSTPGFTSFTISRSLLRLTSIELVMPSNNLVLCHPLSLLASTFHIFRVFSDESVLCIRCPEYWSFSFSISPSVNT